MEKSLEKQRYEETWIGKKIKIIKMIGEPQYTGTEGMVTHVDDFLQLHGTWGGLAIQLGEDSISPILE